MSISIYKEFRDKVMDNKCHGEYDRISSLYECIIVPSKEALTCKQLDRFPLVKDIIPSPLI